jgi:hypothetical protein
MNSPPKEKPLLGREGLRKLITPGTVSRAPSAASSIRVRLLDDRATQIAAARSDRQREERS